MNKYELTPAEKATMESLREKGEVFGLKWRKVNIHNASVRLWQSVGFGEQPQYNDEAAHAVMVQRGLRELGEKWHKTAPWNEILHALYHYSTNTTDMLAAIIAALGDKDDD